MADEVQVLCGSCKSPAQIVTDSDGESEAVCPGCGQRDKVEDALRIAGEHFQQCAASALDKAFRDATRGSKVMQYRPGPKTRRTYRWHAG